MKFPNLETERRISGFSKVEAARILGISRDTYNAWITGEYPIPANFVARLCNLYRCSADYLLAPNDSNSRWKEYRCLNDFDRGVLLA